MRLIPTARKTGQSTPTVKIYLGGSRSPQPQSDNRDSIDSGETSAPIVLQEQGITYIVVEVRDTETVRYPLYLRYVNPKDSDGDGYADIDTLEDLDAIRNRLDGNYELVADLDFLNDASYVTTETNKARWTVDDYADSGDDGWQPLGAFSGHFKGNGHTISNLQINRDASDNQGLFAEIASGGIVADVVLMQATVAGGDYVGALAAVNRGRLIGIHSVGDISGNDAVGGLVGENHGRIINGYVGGEVSGNNKVGGLVGDNRATVLNSRAAGRVSARDAGGGLVGVNDGGRLMNSYASVVVVSDGSAGGLVGLNDNGGRIVNGYARGGVFGGDRVGGLVGDLGVGAVIHSYAVGRVVGDNTLGGLVGVERSGATVEDSYWDIATSGRADSASGVGRSTAALQSPTDATGIYATWQDGAWYFGTAVQYPTLKYTNSADGSAACTDELRDDVSLPRCGDVIVFPESRYGLRDLNYVGSRNISTLEDLNAIRDNLGGNYRLTRDLDFRDAASYSTPTNMALWTVDDYSDVADVGWLPLGTFTGTFVGNGYTIRNLQINRDASDNQGLFAEIASGAIVTDIVLVDATIEGGDTVGMLAASNRGSVIGGRAIGDVSGNDAVGGLVGVNDATILNSRASGRVSGGDAVGGLVGINEATVLNSRATGRVSGGDNVGGLVGMNIGGRLVNGFATVAVVSGGSAGGLVGASSGGGTITNTYARGAVSGSDGAGGLVGSLSDSAVVHSYAVVIAADDYAKGGLVGSAVGDASATDSYWDTTASGELFSAVGIGRTTDELQSPTAAIGIYRGWDAAAWNFGDAQQYPTLKYAPADVADFVACGAESTLPACADDIAQPESLYGLRDLQVAAAAPLDPPFDGAQRIGFYEGTVRNSTATAYLIPTARDADAIIYIYAGGDTYRLNSGDLSGPVSLNPAAATRVIVEVRSTQTAYYNLYLSYEYSVGVDADGDGLIDIRYLEQLDAIRHQPDGSGYRAAATAQPDNRGCPGRCNGYELTRSLDFNDPASYLTGTVNGAWTVADDTTATDVGWMPIGSLAGADASCFSEGSDCFSGIFDGNGYTISNLQIHRNADNQGLFGAVAAAGIVRAVRLQNVYMETTTPSVAVAGLVGVNYGRIADSYVAGTLIGGAQVGALVGRNVGVVNRGRAVAEVRGRTQVGGLVGINENRVVSSYAASDVVATADGVGGLVGEHRTSAFGIARIIASRAAGTVDGDGDRIGGLVGYQNNSAYIERSYATVAVGGGRDGAARGGLVGRVDEGGIVEYSYAMGAVAFTSANSRGGLVGMLSDGGIVDDSYAIGSLSEGQSGGSLVGISTASSINRSYANSDNNPNLPLVAEGDETLRNSSRTTTAKLQEPTAAGTAASDIYYNWSDSIWDFGSTAQYPLLKTDDGALLAPEIRRGLTGLELADGVLSPPFGAGNQEFYGSYFGTALAAANEIRLIPVAAEVGAKIQIYTDGGNTAHGDEINSNDSSAVIALAEDRINHIVVEVRGSETVRYPIYLRYRQDRDKDADGYVDIASVADLQAIRDDLNGRYELSGDIDLAGVAWQPLGDVHAGIDCRHADSTCFGGRLVGNGYTIYNLRIGDSANNTLGLFGAVARDGVVRDISLRNTIVDGRKLFVGALVGLNYGTVIGSDVVGEVNNRLLVNNIGGEVGGLVGENRGSIINSRVAAVVNGFGAAGGLVGVNQRGRIIGSYAVGEVSGGRGDVGGLVGENQRGRIIGSYATATVAGDDDVGGLVGFNVRGEIDDTYATGAVGIAAISGGLVGRNVNGTIVNSYAIGRMATTATATVGSLVGVNRYQEQFESGSVPDAAITAAYADGDVNPTLPLIGETVGSTQTAFAEYATTATTANLKAKRASDDSGDIYYLWNEDEDRWDFGSKGQYPILNYAQNPDADGIAACDAAGLPDCATPDSTRDPLRLKRTETRRRIKTSQCAQCAVAAVCERRCGASRQLFRHLHRCDQ